MGALEGQGGIDNMKPFGKTYLWRLEERRDSAEAGAIPDIISLPPTVSVVFFFCFLRCFLVKVASCWVEWNQTFDEN